MNAKESVSTDDLYEILQVSPSADPEVITAAHDRLSRKYGSDLVPEIREKRRSLDAAYAVLSNPSRRADYDASRGFAGVAAAAPPPVAAPSRGIVACPRDPAVQTALRCSRCETPICPKCLVQTPVGARCRDCARISHSPIYTLSGKYLARGIGAALVGGVVMGLAWGYFSREFPIAGFLSFFVGAGLGYAFTRGMDFATNRKRGPMVMTITIVGIVIAFAIQFVLVDFRLLIGSLIALGVAIYFAYQNLRYV